MQRLYYLAEDVAAAHRIAHDLQCQGVSAGDLHLVADNPADLATHQLSGASLLETTDLLPASESGLLLGIALGSLACTLAWVGGWLTLAGPLAYVGLFIFFAGLGSWLGGLVGLSLDHYKLAQFQPALQKGQVLMMVDSDSPRIEQLMRYQPQAHLVGLGSSWNNPLHPQQL